MGGLRARHLPERLSFGGIVQVPVVLVLLKQSRHQLRGKHFHLVLIQSFVLLHQPCDEEHCGGYFVFHRSL